MHPGIQDVCKEHYKINKNFLNKNLANQKNIMKVLSLHLCTTLPTKKKVTYEKTFKNMD